MYFDICIFQWYGRIKENSTRRIVVTRQYKIQSPGNVCIGPRLQVLGKNSEASRQQYYTEGNRFSQFE
jgi:hypothetical protein